MNAFIIVDMQNDFCPGGALAVKEGSAIVPLINRLQERFEMIVATQDWHPADHMSFASNHGKKAGDVIDLNGQEQVLWPDHCVQNTRGAELVDTLDTAKVSQIFRKGMDRWIDSYSAFFDNGHRKSTGLGDYLREKKIKGIYIAGLATDYCVKYTALDAVKLGFEVAVIADACRGVELADGDTEKALKEIKNAGVSTVFSKDIL